MTENSERDQVIEENLKAERHAVMEISRTTGIELPRLQFISTVEGRERERLRPVVAELISRERNPVIRGVLYGAFGSPVDDKFLAQLIAWHRDEDYDQGLQVLERVIIAHANGVNKQSIRECLLLTPSKIKVAGFRFLVRQSKSDRTLLSRIREGYARCLYDLEVLSVMAGEHKRDYAAIVGLEDGNDRLTGPQCISLINYQLPRNEYGFRRPRLVPFYARILASAVVSESRLAGDIKQFCESNGLTVAGSPSLSAAVRALGSYECVTLAIQVMEDTALTRAAILSLLPRDRGAGKRADLSIRRGGVDVIHREREGAGDKYCLGLIEAPVPPEWNRFPKRLLSADDPLRFVRPD